MFGDKNREIVNDFFNYFSSGDSVSVLKLLDEDVVWQAMGTMGGDPMSVKRNKQEIADLVHKMHTTIKNGIKLTPLAFTCEGERVAVEVQGKGVVIASGKSYDNFYHFLFVIKDDRIVEIKEYMDTLHAKCVFIDK